MTATRSADPSWWRTGSFQGQRLRAALAKRDVTAVFGFLRSRGWSRSAVAAATGLSESRVREIAQGKRIVTSYDVLERIATGLRIDRELMGLGYSDDESAAPVRSASDDIGLDPSLDPEYLASLASMAVGGSTAVLDRLLPSTVAPTGEVPRVVQNGHVKVLAEVSERHRQLDAEQGGGACRDSAAAHLRWAEQMLSSGAESDEAARGLRVALSDMHQVVGWASHDLGDHSIARRHLIAGLAMAREIDDLPRVSGAFHRLGRVSIHQGHALEALRLWQLGQIVAQESGRLVSVAVLHANEAWAYAMLGDASQVGHALARAKGELDRINADDVPPLERFVLAPSEFDGMSAVVYGALASHAEHRATYVPLAIETAQRALKSRSESESRSRTLDAISLASGYALDDQPDQVERYGNLAVDLTKSGASVRAVDRLRDMAALAKSQVAHGGVRSVLERIQALPGGYPIRGDHPQR